MMMIMIMMMMMMIMTMIMMMMMMIRTVIGKCPHLIIAAIDFVLLGYQEEQRLYGSQQKGRKTNIKEETRSARPASPPEVITS